MIDIHTLSFHRVIASNDARSTVEKTQTQAWAPSKNEIQIKLWVSIYKNELK